MIPSSVQEELTKKQPVRTSRIVTRFLERWIWQNHTVTSFFVGVIGLLVQNVADLTQAMWQGPTHSSKQNKRGILEEMKVPRMMHNVG